MLGNRKKISVSLVFSEDLQFWGIYDFSFTIKKEWVIMHLRRYFNISTKAACSFRVNIFDHFLGKIVRKRRFSQLHKKQFSIISNNCWGTFVYQYFGMPYLSPFVGLFVYAPDYIKLIGKLSEYLRSELRFINPEKSRYAIQVTKAGMLNTYRVGKLLDVELHFQHYNNEEDIFKMWNRRLGRVDFNSLIVKFDDRDLCTWELIKAFDGMPFARKVCLTAKEYPYRSTLKLKNENGEFLEKYWVNFKKTVKVVDFINNLMEE
jgi:uncharacterized protein (DUF1919 family)